MPVNEIVVPPLLVPPINVRYAVVGSVSVPLATDSATKSVVLSELLVPTVIAVLSSFDNGNTVLT